ncbi:hypothetical protein QJQ45_027602, partial [Haematococcus lacustris]
CTDQRRGMVVLVDEDRTTRVSSAVNGQQPCEEELDHEQPTSLELAALPASAGLMWCPVVAPRKPPQPPCSSQAATQPAASEPGPSTPPPAKRTKAEPAAEPTQPSKGTGKGKGKAAIAKPAPQPGRSWFEATYCAPTADNGDNQTIYNQPQRRLVRKGQRHHPMLMPVFEDPSNQALLAKLQELGNISLRERFVKLYAKAARAQLGWRGEEAQLFIKMACGYGINAKSSELKAATLDKGHVADLIEEANKHRRLLGMKKQGSLQDTLPLPCRMRHAVHVCRQLGLTKETRAAFTSEPALSHHWARWFDTKKLRNKEFAFERGIAEMREFAFDPDTQIGVGIDPGVTQAVSAASGVWDPATGQLMADQLRRWKLTKGQVKHASGLNNARRDTERWLAPIKPHLQHLAAASSAGTSLEANLKHITVTLATWDAVWEVYLDPKWARQRLRLYGAQDRALEQFFNKLEEEVAEVSMKRHGHAKQLVLFFDATTIGTGGGWGADAVLRACCKVVCRPRGAGQRRGRVVLVDEHRTSRVSSAVDGQQPCEVELNKLSATRPVGWKPPAGQVEQRLVRPAWSQQRDQPVRGLMWCPVVAPRKPPQAPRSGQAATQPAASEPGPSTHPPAKRSKPAAEPTRGKAKGKAAKAKPAPQPGRWLDRDCNAALNMQRIGESSKGHPDPSYASLCVCRMRAYESLHAARPRLQFSQCAVRGRCCTPSALKKKAEGVSVPQGECLIPRALPDLTVFPVQTRKAHKPECTSAEDVFAGIVVPTHAPSSPRSPSQQIVVPSNHIVRFSAPARADCPALQGYDSESTSHSRQEMAQRQFEEGVQALQLRVAALRAASKPPPSCAEDSQAADPADALPAIPEYTHHTTSAVISAFPPPVSHSAAVALPEPSQPAVGAASSLLSALQHRLTRIQPSLVSTIQRTAATAAAIHSVVSIMARPLLATATAMQQEVSSMTSILERTRAAITRRRNAKSQLEQQVAALHAHNQQLTSQVEELTRRAEFAEARTLALHQQQQQSKAQRAVDSAVQVFRRHAASVPREVDVGMFYESQSALIGKGGCGAVYAWQAGGQEWAVKADGVSYRYNYSGTFEPERCGDLLPAFLPPHPHIAAPAAWWVAPASPQQPPLTPHTTSPADLAPAPSPAGTGPATAPTPAGTATGPAAQLAARSGSASDNASGFKLFTMYPRYDCSLREHLDSLAAQAADQPGTAEHMLLDPQDLLVVVRDLAAALQHLAAHRVVHSDLKPENVMLKLRRDASNTSPRIASAVLIDFGLARLLPTGVGRLPARGGTWLYKAPEQLQGPGSGLFGAGGEREDPYVCQATDTWALGALICYMARNGTLRTSKGLPLGLQPHQVAKWGDRPSGQRERQEPFFMAYADVLPHSNLAPAAEVATTAALAKLNTRAVVWRGVRKLRRACETAAGGLPGSGLQLGAAAPAPPPFIQLLQDLASGCMDKNPEQRPAPSTLHSVADAMVQQLQRGCRASAGLSGAEPAVPLAGVMSGGFTITAWFLSQGVSEEEIARYKHHHSSNAGIHRQRPEYKEALKDHPEVNRFMEWRKLHQVCASGSGQQVQGQGQAAKVVTGQRRQVIKAGLRGLVKAAQPDLSPAQVDAIVAEINKRMTMGSKQCCLTAVLCLTLLLQSFLGQPSPAQQQQHFPAAGSAPGPPPPPDPACPLYAHPRLATRSSPRTAAAPAQLPPPVQLNIWDPQLLAQIKNAMELLTNASVLEHMMRGPHHHGIRLLPGDGNSLNANATNIITSIKEFYRHPGRFINKWGKAVGVVGGGFSREMKKHSPQLVLGRLDQPGLPATWREGQDSIGKGGAGRLPIEFRVRSAAIQPQLLQLAGATPAGTTLDGLHAHILALKATWDPLWEEYLKPRWRRQRPGLARPDRLVIVDEFRTTRVSSSVHARQPCELHLPDDRPRPADWVPPAGQVNQQLLRPAWSLRHAKDVRGLKWCHEVPPNPPPPPPAQHPPAQDHPAPPPAQDPPPPPSAQEPPPPAQDQPPALPPPGPVPRPQATPWGRWLDRDTNPCLNFQRIGESKQRPLELCSYEGLMALPPIGKEYQQGYKRVNDRLPKVKQRLHRAAEYRRGIDGRAATMHRP